jgi:hypothetical protein
MGMDGKFSISVDYNGANRDEVLNKLSVYIEITKTTVIRELNVILNDMKNDIRKES